MNKAQLLADLDSKVLRVVGVTQQEDPAKAAAGITVYVANVLQITQAGQAQGRNVGFYVLDEGDPGEAAFYKDSIGTSAADYAAAVTYLDAQAFERYKVREQQPQNGFALADVWIDDGAGGVLERRILLYRDAEGSPTHKVITG